MGECFQALESLSSKLQEQSAPGLTLYSHTSEMIAAWGQSLLVRRH